MATRNIVPRANREGSVGTSVKKWDGVFTEKLNNADVNDLTGWSSEAFRKPSTHYDVGEIKMHPSLPTGFYLECTTAGTTSSGALSTGVGISVYDTITDGTVTWTVCNLHLGTFNKKETFTSSGTFVAPVSGTYKITLQGGGGGGAGAGKLSDSNEFHGGGGGGQGGHLEFYETLTAGASYSYTIGAGGAGGEHGSATTAGAAGSTGGDSSITINSNEYKANGGKGGKISGAGGKGGESTINATAVPGAYGASGGVGTANTTLPYRMGGTGGGAGGMSSGEASSTGNAGLFGGGGAGGSFRSSSGNNQFDGGAGGDGYITFEYCDAA